MSNRMKRLLVVFALVLITVLYWGCTEAPDVVVPVSSSEVTLTPELFPSNFAGMHYELWAANSSDSVSLGKFAYDNNLKKFHELNGAVRADGNRFFLDDDIYRFSKLFVSVEVDADTAPLSPGPIMLIDDITVPSKSSVDLVFPLHDLLWEATCRYNMETPSDSDRDISDGYGIWFASYQRQNDSIRDTFSLDTFWVQTTYDTFPRDTVLGNLIAISAIGDVDSTPIFGVDTSKDTTRIFGVDSFSHEVVRFNRIVRFDSAGAGQQIVVTIPHFVYSIGSRIAFNYDEFTQDSFALPDYTSFGWKYKGWVVSPYVSSANVGQATAPAWNPNSFFDSLMPGIAGGLLTTGTFSKINKPDDDGNPYALSNRLPQFPGEDFLTFPSGWSGLVPNASGNSGTVFISLEPTNFIYDTTNFPLIPFMAEVPKDQFRVTGNVVIINMWNRTQITSKSVGFPKITVGITTF